MVNTIIYHSTKRVDEPLDISGTFTWSLNYLSLPDYHVLPIATEEPLLLPMLEDESEREGNYNESFFPSWDLTTKRKSIRRVPLHVHIHRLVHLTSKLAPNDITNSASTKEMQNPKAIFFTQDSGGLQQRRHLSIASTAHKKTAA